MLWGLWVRMRKNVKRAYPYGCKILKKTSIWVQNFRKRYLYKAIFDQIWVFSYDFCKNCQNPTLMGVKIFWTLPLWVLSGPVKPQFFLKQGHSGGTSAETRSTEEKGPFIIFGICINSRDPKIWKFALIRTPFTKMNVYQPQGVGLLTREILMDV